MPTANLMLPGRSFRIENKGEKTSTRSRPHYLGCCDNYGPS